MEKVLNFLKEAGGYYLAVAFQQEFMRDKMTEEKREHQCLMHILISEQCIMRMMEILKYSILRMQPQPSVHLQPLLIL